MKAGVPKYDISNQIYLAQAVGLKSDFELLREFTFWEKDQGNIIIATELHKRRKGLAIFELFFVGLLTNALLFPVGSLFSFRWLYFEDKPTVILRQYGVGFAFISIFPACNVVVFLRNGGNSTLTFVIVVYGAALAIGLIKTIYDLTCFLRAKKEPPPIRRSSPKTQTNTH